MPPSRRALLIGLGGLVASSGTLVGAGAFSQRTVEAEADMRVLADAGFLELLVGPDADEDQIVARPNGELGIDFARAAGSDGVQPEATYQLGGMDPEGNPNVAEPLQADSVVQASGYPAPTGGGSAQTDAAIIVRNNSGETIGVTVDFEPNQNFPSDGRVLVVMHDKGQAVGGTDVHAKLFGPNGLIASSTNSAEYRAVFSGEELGVSIWIYTGTDEDADMSGILTFSGDDADDLSNIGDTGSGGPTDIINSVSLADGQGNYIDVTVDVTTNDPGAQLRIQSLRSPSDPNTIQHQNTVSAADGTYQVLGSNNPQIERVRVILLDGNGNQVDSVTTSWSP